ncbi:MAG: hypothetical protein AB7F35_00745 [Acetobacteraceae bacterium]
MTLWLAVEIYIAIGIVVLALFTVGIEMVRNSLVADAAFDLLLLQWLGMGGRSETLWLGLGLFIITLWPLIVAKVLLP